jgi:hypothetical protein
MMAMLEKIHDPEAIKRFLVDDDLWQTTLAIAER